MAIDGLVDMGCRIILRATSGTCQALTGILSLVTAQNVAIASPHQCDHLSIASRIPSSKFERHILLSKSSGCRALHNPAWET